MKLAELNIFFLIRVFEESQIPFEGDIYVQFNEKVLKENRTIEMALLEHVYQWDTWRNTRSTEEPPQTQIEDFYKSRTLLQRFINL